jgi:thiol-disulfide isomerase/thioredoxin
MRFYISTQNIARNVGLSAIVILGLSFLATSSLTAKSNDAPEFTHTQAEEWINSAPLTLDDLKGKVVLIDFWTFDCWNCYRSFPWLHELEAQFAAEDFTVIGVHTPEFDHEKIRENIVAKTKEFKLDHPVMIDNDFSYWKAMDNRYWPTFYLIDKQGRIQEKYIGETHAGGGNATDIEAKIKQLL